MTPASSKNAMFSASVREPMKPPTIASTSPRRLIRSAFYLKRSSVLRSARPIAANSRSVIDCVEAGMATQPSSFVA